MDRNTVTRKAIKSVAVGALVWNAPLAAGIMAATNTVLRFRAHRNLRGPRRRLVFLAVNTLMGVAASFATPAMAGALAVMLSAGVMTWAFGGSSHLPPERRRRMVPLSVIEEGPMVDADFRDK